VLPPDELELGLPPDELPPPPVVGVGVDVVWAGAVSVGDGVVSVGAGVVGPSTDPAVDEVGWDMDAATT
jgi:hypothetical protein